MQPGIRLPTPYTVTRQNGNPGKICYSGDIIVWQKKVKIYE